MKFTETKEPVRPVLVVILLALCNGISGCAVRSAEMYRDDTRRLLSAKRSVLEACYDAELQTNRDAGGKVIVHFTVERDTGRLLNPEIDDLLSTPNRTLRGCVLDALRGLTLDPPDERNGDATFTWEFRTARS
jgi:type IV pilus biogenesis protein CpaD/CtpE